MRRFILLGINKDGQLRVITTAQSAGNNLSAQMLAESWAGLHQEYDQIVVVEVWESDGRLDSRVQRMHVGHTVTLGPWAPGAK